MTNTKAVRLALALAAAFCGSAALADSINMDVKASVTGTCKMAAAPALDFGSLDPATAPLVTGKKTTVTYLCTKGKTPTAFTVDGVGTGTYTTKPMVDLGGSGDTIPFKITWNTTLPVGKGMASGQEVSVDLNGEIAAGVYANVTAGNYSVTIPVAVTP